MKKRFKYFITILLTVVMVFSFPFSASAFTRKDVTKVYKKSVTKMLKNFDSYLGYACCNGHYFRYDEYARTTMTAMTNYKLNGHSITYVKKKIKPEMKLYFNTTKMTFKKSSKYQLPQNPSYLVFNKNNKIIYIEGNWGEASPTGNVRKIVKTGLKTYEVTYNIYLYNSWDKINCGLMGTYKIKLKKANNRNGFIITDMKQTVNNKI